MAGSEPTRISEVASQVVSRDQVMTGPGPTDFAVIGVGGFDHTDEWVVQTMRTMAEKLAGFQLQVDASKAAEMVTRRHRGLVHVWAPARTDTMREAGRMIPGSEQWLGMMGKRGHVSYQSGYWEEESVMTVWLRLVDAAMSIIIVHDRSNFARRIVNRAIRRRSEQSVIEIDWRRRQLVLHETKEEQP